MQANFVQLVTTSRPKTGNIPMGHFAGQPVMAAVASSDDNGDFNLYALPTEDHLTWVEEVTGDTTLKPIYVPHVKMSTASGAVGDQHQPGTWTW